jgi:hypothetical protein
MDFLKQVWARGSRSFETSWVAKSILQTGVSSILKTFRGINIWGKENSRIEKNISTNKNTEHQKFTTS